MSASARCRGIRSAVPSPSALRLLVQRSPSAITARKKPIACVARIIVRAQFGMCGRGRVRSGNSLTKPQNLVLDNHKKAHKT